MALPDFLTWVKIRLSLCERAGDELLSCGQRYESSGSRRPFGVRDLRGVSTRCPQLCFSPASLPIPRGPWRGASAPLGDGARGCPGKEAQGRKAGHPPQPRRRQGRVSVAWAAPRGMRVGVPQPGGWGAARCGCSCRGGPGRERAPLSAAGAALGGGMDTGGEETSHLQL